MKGRVFTKQSKNGITLIALVVTIVVLLILAGVSIVMLSGEDGIMNQAQKSNLETSHATVKEKIKLKFTEYQMQKKLGYTDNFITFLNKDITIVDETTRVINVFNLLGNKLNTGNGTNSTDVYKLEDYVGEIAKLASTQVVNISNTDNTEEKYVLNYYGKSTNDLMELEILGANNSQISDSVNDSTKPQNYKYKFNAGYKDGEVTSDIIAYVVETDEITEDGEKVYEMLFIGEGEMAPLGKWDTEYVDVTINEYAPASEAYYAVDVYRAEISDGIVTIGEMAFLNCSTLQSIIIPESVTNINDLAFLGCTSLTSITIPDSVTRIGWLAFMNCDSLTNITIPEKVTNIGDQAFGYCDNLEVVTISEGVNSIGYEAFACCSSLKSITIPSSLTSISYSAFNGCNSLTAINIKQEKDSISGSPWGASSSNIVNWNYTGE